MAWLSGHSKRKELVLTGGASGALSDFQLELAIAYAAAMQGDFDDIRFTRADGTTLVDAWAEVIITDTSATVWVEFPSTPANTVEQTYYMYYGKADALDYWDIGDTFVFGDDFEDYMVGDLNGQGGWSVTGSQPTLTDVVSSPVQDGVRAGQMFSTDTNADHTISGLTKGAVTFYGRNDSIKDGRYYYMLYDGGVMKAHIAFDNDGYIDCQGTQLQTYSINTYYKITGIFDFGADEWLEVFVDDVSKGTNIAFTAGTQLDKIRITGGGQAGGTGNFDLIYIRKYVTNPPTYAFGSEESAPTGVAPTAVFYGPFFGPFRGPI
jgi:hypothetical protein